MSPLAVLSILLFLIFVYLAQSIAALRFEDVTSSSGLTQPSGPSLKYGGAMLADVNGDGWLDMLLLHHNSAPAEFYFSVGGLKYVRANWSRGGDIHGATAFRYSPLRKGLSIVVQRGGGWGFSLQAPFLYNVLGGGQVLYTAEPGFPPEAGARGRTALALSLRKAVRNYNSRPDLILTSAHLINGEDHQRGLELTGKGGIALRNIQGPFEIKKNEFANLVDVDNDGQMEVVGFQSLHIFKINGDFSLRNVTGNVLPAKRQYNAYDNNAENIYRQWNGVIATAEFDFDNDGRWDMYVARTTLQNLHWLPKTMLTDDVLLHNVGGRFADVSVSAGITPALNGFSRGVTVGDFDNDGFVDIIVARYIGQDQFLHNNGDGTFAKPVDAGFRRKDGIPGDMVTAADLDEDGRLDVVVSEGSWYNPTGSSSWGNERGAGYYRIMRNVMDRREMGNYLLVRVGNSPRGYVTSLHATVSLQFDGESGSMNRRVGNPGAASAVSFIETLHFGVGSRQKVAQVVVRWTNGERQILRNAQVNKKYVVGKL